MRLAAALSMLTKATARLVRRVVPTMTACLVLSGCAIRGTKAGRGYDTLEKPKCGESGTSGEVLVWVRDQRGQPIPGVRVHLIQADAPAGVFASAMQGITDARGTVTLNGPGSHYHSLLVGPVGFVPEARLFLLEQGCTGTITVTLRVLQVDGLS